MRILAETGRVDSNKRDKFGWTPLFRALYRGHSDIVGIIVQQPNIDFNVIVNSDGDTLGHAAVMGRSVKCVETLAAQEKFDCWNVPDSDGDTPIMWALKWNKMETVQILLRCPRVDLDIVEADKKTSGGDH